MPDQLSREEVIHPGPDVCSACRGTLRRIASEVTETLDYTPRRFKLIQHVRGAFSCRACETVIQAPASIHTIARGRAGPGLPAHIAVAKFDNHLPLYRQAEMFVRDGVHLETSTLSGRVEATAAALMPLDLLLREVIGSSSVLHGDDTPVPILAPAPEGPGRVGFGFTFATTRPALAREALERIGSLCAVRRDLRSKPPDERRMQRQARSLSIANALKAWAEDMVQRTVPMHQLANL